MAKLVDAGDLKSPAERRAGSSPALGTKNPDSRCRARRASDFLIVLCASLIRCKYRRNNGLLNYIEAKSILLNRGQAKLVRCIAGVRRCLAAVRARPAAGAVSVARQALILWHDLCC